MYKNEEITDGLIEIVQLAVKVATVAVVEEEQLFG